MQISARNKFKGRVIGVTPGIVTAEVELDIGNGQRVVGVITKQSLDEMDIKENDTLSAFIKATSVIFIKE